MLIGITTFRKISTDIARTIAVCHSMQSRVNGYR